MLKKNKKKKHTHTQSNRRKRNQSETHDLSIYYGFTFRKIKKYLGDYLSLNLIS